MSVDALLPRLQGVKKTGADRWIACCPAHEDRHPSMAIAMSAKNPGNVVIRCFAGCEPEEILAAIGLTFDALFPERALDHHIHGQRRPFFPTDVFEIALREMTIVAVISSRMHANRTISDADYERLFVAAGRLNNIAEAAYGK